MYLPARNPEDLARFFVERANQGDVDGVAALYGAEAVLAGQDGRSFKGSAAIRAFYENLLSPRPQFSAGDQVPALRAGDLALTSSRLQDGTVTAEVAQRQPDGSWLWIIDQPAINR